MTATTATWCPVAAGRSGSSRAVRAPDHPGPCSAPGPDAGRHRPSKRTQNRALNRALNRVLNTQNWPLDLPQKWTIHLGRSAPSVVLMTATRNTRVKIASLAPDFYKALIALDDESATGLDERLADLVRIRASQLNGCAYCLDMHTLDARHAGDSEQRLYLVGAWREARKFYSPQEQ